MLARGRAFLMMPVGSGGLYCYADLKLKTRCCGATPRRTDTWGTATMIATPYAGYSVILPNQCRGFSRNWTGLTAFTSGRSKRSTSIAASTGVWSSWATPRMRPRPIWRRALRWHSRTRRSWPMRSHRETRHSKAWPPSPHGVARACDGCTSARTIGIASASCPPGFEIFRSALRERQSTRRTTGPCSTSHENPRASNDASISRVSTTRGTANSSQASSKNSRPIVSSVGTEPVRGHPPRNAKRTRRLSSTSWTRRQQCLNLRPLPQGQGSLQPTVVSVVDYRVLSSCVSWCTR